MEKNSRKSAFDFNACVRQNILALKPYRCARDDYKDNGNNILLDANENAYGPGLPLTSEHAASADKTSLLTNADILGLNRYPDPHQIGLKRLFCDLRNTHKHTSKDLDPSQLFVGVGSDEAIDNVIRCFCVPGKDKILTCPPTYGMYAVSAQINDICIVEEPLDAENAFSLRPQAINQRLSADPHIKVVYICSPGNPTGSLIRKEDIQPILEHPSWNGVIVLDEAYIDFAPEGSSLAEWVLEWPNLIVMQTLSKAFGLAGIRLGVAFTSPTIALYLNSLKAPYNVSSPASALACQALQNQGLGVMQSNRQSILTQRERLIAELPKIPGVGHFRGGMAANFLLVEMRDASGKPNNEIALSVYEQLAESKGVVVRFRGKEFCCTGCLRITVGTEKENDRLLADLRSVLNNLLRGTTQTAPSGRPILEEIREKEASSIVA